MKPVSTVTIAAKDEVFDRLFRDWCRTVKLRGDAAEVAYEAKHVKLRKKMDGVGKRLFVAKFVERHLYEEWDWWPDNTQHVEASMDALTQDYYDRLRSLLKGDYAEWRIQVVVYGLPRGRHRPARGSRVPQGQTMVGSIVIWADRVLIDRALYGVLMWRGIDLRCEAEAIWHK